jgi:hypothetical protein
MGREWQDGLRAPVRALMTGGAVSLGAIARGLEERGRLTVHGSRRWHPATVRRLLDALHIQTLGIGASAPPRARRRKREPGPYASPARQAWAEALRPTIEELRELGASSLPEMAAGLEDRGCRTRRGRTRWHAATVARLLALLDG